MTISEPAARPNSDVELMREVVAVLREGGEDLEPTVVELVERDTDARVILDRTRAHMLVRLHNRSDDHAATMALQALSTASARLATTVVRPAKTPPTSPSSSVTEADKDAARTLHTFLVVAVLAELAWLLWHHPGPWQFGVVSAITVAIVLPDRRRRRLVPEWMAGTFQRVARIHAVDTLRRGWLRIPAEGRMTIPLLALFNALLALVDSGTRFLGIVASPTALPFVAMLIVNVVIVNSWFRATPEPELVTPPGYVFGRNPPLKPIDWHPRPSDGHDNGLAKGNGGAHRTAGDGQTIGPVTTNGHALSVAQAGPVGEGPASRPSLLQHAAAIAAAVVALGWIAYEHPGGPFVLLAVLVLGLTIPFTRDVDRHDAVIMVLALAVGVATVDYVSWRFSVTNWQGWWLAVPLLLAETMGAIHVLGFQFTIWPRPVPVLDPTEDPTTFPVFILVPTLNEGVDVVRPTLEGCIGARSRYLAEHPRATVTIVVCNDGRAAGVSSWAEIDALALELDVECVTRRDGGGAKAGNIEHARRELQISGKSLVVVFDADQIPEPDFLLETVPPFADSAVGWVQTGQYYSNLDNPVARWADDQQSMFYNLLCPGKAALNAAFICGTNVVIRAAALDEIGGFPQDSVTEDFAASIRLHPRWRSVYLPDVLARGLGPFDIPSYLKQQGRWSLGTLGVFRGQWRDILLPRKNGLRLGQRVQYYLACTHYLCGIRDVVFMLSPMLFIITTIPAVRNATLGEYLWHFVPYVMLSAAAMWFAGRGVTSLRGVIIGFGSFPALVGSLVAVLSGRRSSFAVTSKQRDGRRSLNYLCIYAVFAALCIVCLLLATRVSGAQRTSLFISVLWLAYSLLLLASFLWLAVADRRANAVTAQSALSTDRSAERRYAPKRRTTGLRPVGGVALAALLATPLLMTGRLATLPLVAPGGSTPFAIGKGDGTAPYVGVSLAVQLLKSRPPVLERELGTRFSIVGRTQDVRDNFDRDWASELAASGARPWITLQFGIFGPGHKRPIDANLPAIYNGVRDADIRRWATAIRDFGEPVYLTILPHVDKNWAVSSGVGYGGIPQDVPKAWTHVQSVFRAVGANNVAWVWAPADPAHDQQFAPPSSTIDAVLQSFINYPGTRWGSPASVLRAVTRRHPGTPLFVEASVSGPAAQKAAWLSELRQAVEASPRAYAVLYHEGGPSLSLTSREERSWSLASDPQSLAAMRRLVREVRSGTKPR